MRPSDDRYWGRNKRHPGSWRETTSVHVFGVATICAPLLFGGTFGWTNTVIALLLCASALFVELTVGDRITTRVQTPAVMLFAAAFLWTAIQSLPLPCGVVHFFLPQVADTAREVARLTGAPPHCALSQAPGGTHAEVIKGAAILASFMAAWLLSVTGKRRELRKYVAYSVISLVLVTLGHVAAGASQVYGFYAPREAAPRFLGPLLNTNNMAGLTAMGAPLAVGLALESSRRAKTVAWFVTAVLLSFFVIATGSRGAVGALALGLALLTSVSLWRGARKRRRRSSEQTRMRRRWVAAAVAFVVAAPVVLLFAQELRVPRNVTDVSKLSVAKTALEFSLNFPWTGVGRGAFSDAFAATLGTRVRYEYPENLPAQWLSEWGIPFGLLLLAGFSTVLLRALRAHRSPSALGAIAAIVTIASHNLVDFNLELLGVALLPTTLLATVCAQRRRVRRTGPVSERPPPFQNWTLWRRVAVGVAATTAALLAWSTSRYDRDELRWELARVSQHGSSADYRSLLQSALWRFPRSPGLHLEAAVQSLRNNDRSTGRWLNRTMLLAPGWAGPHLLAARWFLQQGRTGQAVVELHEAASLSLSGLRPILCPVLRATNTMDVVRRVAPKHQQHSSDYYDTVSRCRNLSDELTIAINDEYIRRVPDEPAPYLRKAQRASQRGDHATALKLAQHVLGLNPKSTEAVLIASRASHDLGRDEDAIQMLRRHRGTARDPDKLLSLEAHLHAKRMDATTMRNTLEQLRVRAGGRPKKLTQMALLRAKLEGQAGSTTQALRAYDEAYDHTPDPRILESAAKFAEKRGDLRRAMHYYMQLRALDPSNRAHDMAVTRLARENVTSSVAAP